MSALPKVLVVDDDLAVCKSFDRILTNKGYAVITARSGEEALAKLNEEKYDIVYTDIRMPGMSGLEVAEKVKARRPWTPVVIITGYGTDIAEARAKAAGVSGFLHKPLSPEMIEDSARDVLAAPAAVAEAAIAAAAAAERPAAGAVSAVSVLMNVALFFAAPFIGLAYMIAIPFVGFGILALAVGRLAAKNKKVKAVGVALRHVGMFIATPFIGLIYVVLFPFVGLALLLWMATKASAAAVKG
ncbi:MAG TPA: response regulator [Xanthobacteraceae bacterium]|nr:response regulator [Xanthobacteraceae bacterium]